MFIKKKKQNDGLAFFDENVFQTVQYRQVIFIFCLNVQPRVDTEISEKKKLFVLHFLRFSAIHCTANC
jgi:hypothetical protein